MPSSYLKTKSPEQLVQETSPDNERPFRVPLVPWLPILGIVMCGLLMLSLPVLTWARFAVWMVVGLGIYFAYGVRHSHLQSPAHAETPGRPAARIS